MAINRGRPVTYTGREISHRTIPMTTERSLALGRAAAVLGVSRAVLITRFIDAALAVFGEDECVRLVVT